MKIIIIDDDKIITYALVKIIETDSDMEIMGVGFTYEDAINLIKTKKPELALLDIRLKEKTGIDILKYIKENSLDIKVLFLTTFLDDEYIKNAIDYGASGYILKDDFENIVPAIKTVGVNQNVFGREIIEKIYSKREIKENIDDILTDKEISILKEIAEGLNNKEIADKLFLSEGTVRNYISIILSKLNLRDRTQLAIYYLNNCQ